MHGLGRIWDLVLPKRLASLVTARLGRSMASGKIPGYPANCVTLLVDQEDVGDDRKAVETVLSAHKELGALVLQWVR